MTIQERNCNTRGSTARPGPSGNHDQGTGRSRLISVLMPVLAAALCLLVVAGCLTPAVFAAPGGGEGPPAGQQPPRIESASFSPEGSHLAVFLANQTVVLFTAGGDMVFSQPSETPLTGDPIPDPLGHFVLVPSRGGYVPVSGSSAALVSGRQEGAVLGVTGLQKGAIVTGNLSGVVVFTNLTTGEKTSFRLNHTVDTLLSGPGSVLAAGPGNASPEVFSVLSPEGPVTGLADLPGPGTPVAWDDFFVALVPSPGTVLLTDPQGKTKLPLVVTGAVRSVLPGRGGRDDPVVLSSGTDDLVSVYSAANGTLTTSLPYPRGDVAAIGGTRGQLLVLLRNGTLFTFTMPDTTHPVSRSLIGLPPVQGPATPPPVPETPLPPVFIIAAGALVVIIVAVSIVLYRRRQALPLLALEFAPDAEESVQKEAKIRFTLTVSGNWKNLSGKVMLNGVVVTRFTRPGEHTVDLGTLVPGKQSVRVSCTARTAYQKTTRAVISRDFLVTGPEPVDIPVETRPEPEGPEVRVDAYPLILFENDTVPLTISFWNLSDEPLLFEGRVLRPHQSAQVQEPADTGSTGPKVGQIRLTYQSIDGTPYTLVHEVRYEVIPSDPPGAGKIDT